MIFEARLNLARAMRHRVTGDGSLDGERQFVASGINDAQIFKRRASGVKRVGRQTEFDQSRLRDSEDARRADLQHARDILRPLGCEPFAGLDV